MRILQVISSYPPAYSYGGALKVAHGLSKQLVSDGHEVSVFTTDVYDATSRLHYISNPEIIDGIKVFRFRNISNDLARRNIPFAPSMFLALKKEIKKCDIIHLHEYRSFHAVMVRHFAERYRVPYILQAHGSVLPFLEKHQLKQAFDMHWGNQILTGADRVVAVSGNELQQYIAMGIREDKVAVIPNGIDIGEFTTLPEKGLFRKKYSLPSEDRIVLYLGRIHRSKGIDFLIDAVAPIIRTNRRIKLVIVGSDEGYLEDLINQIDSLKIRENVIITGPLYQGEKLEALVDADLLVYPGPIEIFGLVPFEAIMCGTPVIVSRNCGCGELIENAHCGYLVNYGDKDELTEKVRTVLDNPDEAASTVRAGQAYILDQLQYPTIAHSFEELYEDCIRNV
jgi:glycosyltransferase involved in cell wall biosynthesis